MSEEIAKEVQKPTAQESLNRLAEQVLAGKPLEQKSEEPALEPELAEKLKPFLTEGKLDAKKLAGSWVEAQSLIGKKAQEVKESREQVEAIQSMIARDEVLKREFIRAQSGEPPVEAKAEPQAEAPDMNKQIEAFYRKNDFVSPIKMVAKELVENELAGVRELKARVDASERAAREAEVSHRIASEAQAFKAKHDDVFSRDENGDYQVKDSELVEAMQAVVSAHSDLSYEDALGIAKHRLGRVTQMRDDRDTRERAIGVGSGGVARTRIVDAPEDEPLGFISRSMIEKALPGVTKRK